MAPATDTDSELLAKDKWGFFAHYEPAYRTGAATSIASLAADASSSFPHHSEDWWRRACSTCSSPVWSSRGKAPLVRPPKGP
jgi:hypothetical protein